MLLKNHLLGIKLIAICMILSCISCKSRQKTLKLDEVKESKEITLDFPYDVIGYWEGELEIIQAEGSVQKLPMSMLIEETADTETFGWQLIYNAGEEEDKRSYLLMEIDREKGYYQIDEDNGIVLEAYLFGNKLVSTFAVQGSLLTVVYTFLQEVIIFEVFAGPLKPSTTTGDIKVGEMQIPPVDSYKTTTFQRGEMKRVRG